MFALVQLDLGVKSWGRDESELSKGAWLAQSIEHVTSDLEVLKFKLHVGRRDYLKEKEKKMNISYFWRN